MRQTQIRESWTSQSENFFNHVFGDEEPGLGSPFRGNTDLGLDETWHPDRPAAAAARPALGGLGSVSHRPFSPAVMPVLPGGLVSHVESSFPQPGDRLGIWIPGPLGNYSIAQHRILDNVAKFKIQFVIHLTP